jgi:hypothetical protein
MAHRLLPFLSAFAFSCGGDTPSEDTRVPDTDTPSVTDTDTDTDTPSGLAITGTYTDDFGADHTITDSLWTTAYSGYPTSYFSITAYDNASNYVIAENDAGNSYYGSRFSRFDWHVDGDGDLWFCQTTYNAPTESDALATPRADDSDPANLGCGGFSWAKLTP